MNDTLQPNWRTLTPDTTTLPMVEIFETVEGEGTAAGFPTTFVRLFNCNLRCSWCDTTYSYAPHKPAFTASVREIVAAVSGFGHSHICLTGGEPLLYTQKVLLLLHELSKLSFVQDIHIETGGGIDLTPFVTLREESPAVADKVRFILDYKLPASGETDTMVMSNYALLTPRDEVKFVIANDEDFNLACEVVRTWVRHGTILFSPVWETMPPADLVAKILEHKLRDVKLSLQIHKVIWDPNRRGV
jgi:7-carboxy-7-deazaguanine synthase